MSEATHTAPATPGPDAGKALAGTASSQPMTALRHRQAAVIIVNALTYAALLWASAHVLGTGGWTFAGVLAMVCIAIGAPWTILGFWNALIGLWLLHFHRGGLAAVAPYLDDADEHCGDLGVRTAILMTMRNEPPERAIARMRIVKASIDATGQGAHFDYYLLSDTYNDAIATQEQRLADLWREEAAAPDRIIYRRRQKNTGFKAGNLRDFCARWGSRYELMLPLDADSLMTGQAVLSLVRIMQAHPRIGILQSLVVGMPSNSAFARIFQFGMRHGMRAYTMGQAWWVGDCGPFWGHNAVVRIKPFMDHCELPLLPGKPPLGGPILSHDQVEAVLMRRAGYEVRIQPMEGGSYEENPPTMIDFASRDLRWCQGNMQYVHLLSLPGLKLMSRFQLTWAIAMFAGLPAWTLLIALTPVLTWQAQQLDAFPATYAAVTYVCFLVMQLMPKLAGLLDTVLTVGGVARYGGLARFSASALIEVVFSFIQGAISALRTTIFMIGLAFGKSVIWGGQVRDAYGLSWSRALTHLWPQTLFGLIVCTGLYLTSPAVFYWSLPMTLGYLVSVPFAVITASPALGRTMRNMGLAAIPEDLKPPPELSALNAGTQP